MQHHDLRCAHQTASIFCFTLFREKGTHSRLRYLCASKLKFIKLSKAKKKNVDTDEKIVQKGESI